MGEGITRHEKGDQAKRHRSAIIVERVHRPREWEACQGKNWEPSK